MTWTKFFGGLRKFTAAFVRFFGRLLRDVLLEAWRPIRRLIVKWAPIAIAAFLLLWLLQEEPAGAQALLTVVLAGAFMVFGLRMLFGGFGGKKKKRKRG